MIARSVAAVLLLWAAAVQVLVTAGALEPGDPGWAHLVGWVVVGGGAMVLARRPLAAALGGGPAGPVAGFVVGALALGAVERAWVVAVDGVGVTQAVTRWSLAVPLVLVAAKLRSRRDLSPIALCFSFGVAVAVLEGTSSVGEVLRLPEIVLGHGLTVWVPARAVPGGGRPFAFAAIAPLLVLALVLRLLAPP